MAADLFYIMSEMNGFVLEIENNSSANGAKLLVNHYHGGQNQLFRFKPNGEIAVASTGKGLNVQGGAVNGHRIIQWPPCDSPNQLWRIHRDGTIRCLGTNLCLDVLGCNKSPCAAVGAYYHNGGSNQKWRLVNKFD